MWLEVVAATVLAFPGLVVSSAPAPGQVAHGRLLIIRTEDTTVVRYGPVWTGRPSSFTLVLPVPDSLESFEPLPRDAFDAVDELTAPRVEDTAEVGACDASEGWKKSLTPPRSSERARPTRPQEYDVERVDRGTDVVARLVALGRTPRPELEARLRTLSEAGSAFLLLHVDGKKLSGSPGATALTPISVRWKGAAAVPLETSAPRTELLINAVTPNQWTLDRPFAYPPSLELSRRAGADPSIFVASLTDSLLATKPPGTALVEHVRRLADTDVIAGLTDLVVPELVQVSNRDLLTPAQLEDAEHFIRTDPTIRRRARQASAYSMMRARLRVTPQDSSLSWLRLSIPLRNSAMELRVVWRAVTCRTEVVPLAELLPGWPATRLADDPFPLVRQPRLVDEAHPPPPVKLAEPPTPAPLPVVDEPPDAEELEHANTLARSFDLGGPPEGPMPKVIAKRDASGQVVHVYRYPRGQLTMRNNQMTEFRR